MKLSMRYELLVWKLTLFSKTRLDAYLHALELGSAPKNARLVGHMALAQEIAMRILSPGFRELRRDALTRGRK